MADQTVVVDTHVLLWWFGDRKRLSKRATALVSSAPVIGVCPITFWEVAMLHERGRIGLDRPILRWVAQVESTHRFETLPLRAPICVKAARLPSFHGDPADRLIVATALDAAATLVTKDTAIAGWGSTNQLTTVW